MNSHLSSDQVHRLAIGDANREEERHAHECDQCSRELMRLAETLSLFRDSAQHWSQQSRAAVVPDTPFVLHASSRLRMHLLRWALAAAVLVILVALPAYKNVRDRHRKAQAIADALLLEQVNADLSRVVSAPMERFVVLLAADPGKEVGGRQ